MKLIKRSPAVCASIIEHSVEEFLTRIREVRGADFIEIRADGLKVEVENFSSETKRLLHNARLQSELPLLLTVRNEKEGGVFPGSERDRANVILESLSLVEGIDVELRMEDELRDEIIQQAKSSNVDVIVSYHDLHSTPSEDALIGVLEEEESIGANIAKIAVFARNKRDVFSLLRVLERALDRLSIPVIAIALGDVGRVSRVVAPLLGSVATYGYVGRETAPGQIEAEKLREILDLLS